MINPIKKEVMEPLLQQGRVLRFETLQRFVYDMARSHGLECSGFKIHVGKHIKF